METVQINDLIFVVAPEEFVVAPGRRKLTQKPPRPIHQSKLILAVAENEGWEDVEVIGRGGMIVEPIEINGWMVMPFDRFKGIIPQEGLDRMETLKDWDFKIKGFLIADDAGHPRYRKPRISPETREKLDKAASTTGKVLLFTAVGAMAAVAIVPVVLILAAFTGVAMAWDPMIICVTEENEWVGLYRWVD